MTRAKQRRSLEEAIVDTVREPLVVLDDAFRVVVASRSFYRAFSVTSQETEGRFFYELGNGQWDIPALRELLTKIIPHHTAIEEFEVEHDFPSIGLRTMLLNARKVFYEGNNSTSLLCPPAASPPPCEAFTRNEDQDWVAKQDMTVPGPTAPKQIKAGTIVNDELQDALDDRCKK